jgi:hypothetical protein
LYWGDIEWGRIRKRELASTAAVRLIDREGLQNYLDDYNQKLIEVFQAEEENVS